MVQSHKNLGSTLGPNLLRGTGLATSLPGTQAALSKEEPG